MEPSTGINRADEMQLANREAIARFNDETRRGTYRHSKVVATAGLKHLLAQDGENAGGELAHEIINQRALLRLINDTPIDPGDDPHGERDFGVVVFKDHKIFWKIDYYANDGTFSFGSEEPWDSSKTFRMMTIMLASEY